jgi:NAD(P)-dependent dehydrogenase (short-subunit alcohol dehydrogenase family)
MIGKGSSTVELDENDWERQFDKNLTYVYRACKSVLPIMLDQGGGAIVNVSSIAAIRHYGPIVAAYAASKAGLIQLTRSIALQYASQGIRCNCIVPGLMDTPLVAARLAGQQAGGDLEALKARRHRTVPMGRMGDAWDVAHAAVFLASDEARYITAALGCGACRRFPGLGRGPLHNGRRAGGRRRPQRTSRHPRRSRLNSA